MKWRGFLSPLNFNELVWPPQNGSLGVIQSLHNQLLRLVKFSVAIRVVKPLRKTFKESVEGYDIGAVLVPRQW